MKKIEILFTKRKMKADILNPFAFNRIHPRKSIIIIKLKSGDIFIESVNNIL